MAKKKVNVELNLTPFIGLFALLVVMLLLTASWNQVYSLNTNTANSSESDSPPPPDEEKVSLTVTVMTDYLELSAGEDSQSIPYKDGEIDLEPFIATLKNWKERFPTQTAVTLNTHNQVKYNELIVVFDTLVGNGWPDVGVSTH